MSIHGKAIELIRRKGLLESIRYTLKRKNLHPESWKTIKKKKVAVFFTRKNVYKIAWKESAILLFNRELNAKEESEIISPIWRERGVFFSPIAKTRGHRLSINKARRLPRAATLQEINEFCQEVIDSIPKDTKMKTWKKTLHQDGLRKLYSSLEKKDSEKIEEKLKNIKLPETGSHGDMIQKNIFMDVDNQIKLIDWEYFNPQGSVITDILRLYSNLYARRQNTHQFNPCVLKKGESLPIIIPPALCGMKASELDMDSLSWLAAVNNCCIPSIILPPSARVRKLEQWLKSNSF